MDKLFRNCCSGLLVLAGALTAFAAENPAAAPPSASPPPAAPVPPIATTAAAPAQATNVGPKIQFAMPIYDFGKTQSGELVKYTFSFTNIGDATLEVTDVRPSCGCTTAGD